MGRHCKSNRLPVLSHHSTSDPPAFWEQVKLQLIAHRQRGCLPRASSPSRHSDIDGCEKMGDGFSIIYGDKEEASFPPPGCCHYCVYMLRIPASPACLDTPKAFACGSCFIIIIENGTPALVFGL